MDRYNFIPQSEPSIFVTTGHRSFDPGQDGRQLDEHFMRRPWYRASDDRKLPFQWRAAARFTRLNYLLGLDIANDPSARAGTKATFR